MAGLNDTNAQLILNNLTVSIDSANKAIEAIKSSTSFTDGSGAVNSDTATPPTIPPVQLLDLTAIGNSLNSMNNAIITPLNTIDSSGAVIPKSVANSVAAIRALLGDLNSSKLIQTAANFNSILNQIQQNINQISQNQNSIAQTANYVYNNLIPAQNSINGYIDNTPPGHIGSLRSNVAKAIATALNNNGITINNSSFTPEMVSTDNNVYIEIK